MIIVYSSSDSYAEIAGISILSLFENNKDADEIIIYIVDNGIAADNKRKLLGVASQFGRMLHFLTPPDIQAMLGIQLTIAKWNISTYYRLFLCSILPQQIERVIFLDGDTIVRGSLGPLWELDLGDCSVAAVDDTRSDYYKLELGLKASDTYTNSGVMVIDMTNWRQEDVQQQFIDELMKGRGNIPYVDQGVLNAVLSKQKKVMVLPPKYNAMTFLFYFSYSDLLRFRRPSSPYLTEAEYNEAVISPIVVHFFPCFMAGTRPWHENDTHKFTPEYCAYKALSPWKEMPYRPDNRKTYQKAGLWVCKHMPKGLMLFCVSLLHARVMPMMRIIKKQWETLSRIKTSISIHAAGEQHV